MANIFVKTNEATAARRRVYFQCVDATDGMTAETGEAGGQPQISVDGASWTNTGIGTLVAIGQGRYYADITQATVNVADAVISTRYKSANTAECIGDTVIIGFASEVEVAAAVKSALEGTDSLLAALVKGAFTPQANTPSAGYTTWTLKDPANTTVSQFVVTDATGSRAASTV